MLIIVRSIGCFVQLLQLQWASETIQMIPQTKEYHLLLKIAVLCCGTSATAKTLQAKCPSGQTERDRGGYTRATSPETQMWGDNKRPAFRHLVAGTQWGPERGGGGTGGQPFWGLGWDNRWLEKKWKTNLPFFASTISVSSGSLEKSRIFE